MRLVGPLSSGIAAGTAGAATANQTSTVRICGRVIGIAVKYNDTPPVTTDVTIATAGLAAPALTLLTLTNQAMDVWKFPRLVPHDLAGVTLTTLAIAESLPIDDFVKVTIAQADAADSADVWLMLD